MKHKMKKKTIVLKIKNDNRKKLLQGTRTRLSKLVFEIAVIATYRPPIYKSAMDVISYLCRRG